MEYIICVFASSAKALSPLDFVETFPWLSLWPRFQLQSIPPRRYHHGKNPHAPASQHPTEKFRQCRLNSCTVGTKAGCSFILYRGRKPQKTKGKEHHNQWASCARGESKRVEGELRDSWCTLGSQDTPLLGSVCWTGLCQMKQNGPMWP